MPDLIYIEQLELSTRIGVPEEERANPQRLTVSITLEPTNGFADVGDNLSNTVDYFAVSRAVQELAAERPRQLIETLAEEIARLLLTRFAIASVAMELRKFILPDTAYVAVRLTRKR